MTREESARFREMFRAIPEDKRAAFRQRHADIETFGWRVAGHWFFAKQSDAR